MQDGIPAFCNFQLNIKIKIVTTLSALRKCDYNELKISYLKLSLLQIVGYQNNVQL